MLSPFWTCWPFGKVNTNSNSLSGCIQAYSPNCLSSLSPGHLDGEPFITSHSLWPQHLNCMVKVRALIRLVLQPHALPGLRDRWQCLERIPFPSLFVNCSPGPRTVRMSTLQKPLYLPSYFAPFSELTLWLQKDSPPYTTMISLYSNGASHLG